MHPATESSSPGFQDPKNAFQILEFAAKGNPNRGITAYPEADTEYGRRLTYPELVEEAHRRAHALISVPGFQKGHIVLVHFSNHLDNILWFWAVLYAGCTPAMSPPLPNDEKTRLKHLTHVNDLLENPLCITSRSFVDQFACHNSLKTCTVESLDLDAKTHILSTDLPPSNASSEDLMALMLTSGSTGNSKAVCITHGQAIASVKGKATIIDLEDDHAFLNWIGLDHVAGLLETHLIAVYLAKDQIHAQATDMIAEPTRFLELISRHNVGRAFSPNFLLANLVKAVGSRGLASVKPYDLRCLRIIVSGGEANPVRTCEAMSKLLLELGASCKVLVPAWGMTETCGGSIYNIHAPNFDIGSGGEYASLGYCVSGMEMRIAGSEPARPFTDRPMNAPMPVTASESEGEFSKNCKTEEAPSKDPTALKRRDSGWRKLNPLSYNDSESSEQTSANGLEESVAPTTLVANDEQSEREAAGPGRLEVRGPIVFERYYNNETATQESFNSEGWFDTGDEAIIDAKGALHIVGRIKETIRINGVTVLPTDIEATLNDAIIPGATATFYVCFSYRLSGDESERVAVAYLPTYSGDDIETRARTERAIVKNVMLQTGVCPYVLPLDSTILQKSTLGKLSRGKVKTGFVQGAFSKYQKENEEALRAYREASMATPANETEEKILKVFRDSLCPMLELPERMISVETSILDLGVSSLQLITLKQRVEKALGIPDLPMIKIMTNTTVRDLAKEVQALSGPREYDPVVKLHEGGSKTPLWLFHPGVGEILVFLNLAKFIDDRPVYALRARGFNEGEGFFQSVEGAVQTYFRTIKKHQPHGPYAIAGYSFGSMVAFETAKLLEAAKPDARSAQPEVAFLGCLNLPPHIKFRMRQFDWIQCLLHLSFFLSLVPEEAAHALEPELRALASRAAVLRRLTLAAAPGRFAELALTPAGLANWADLAWAMQSMARDYEPRGRVPVMDVFFCDPLAVVARDKRDWLDNHLHAWRDFVAEPPRFHEVGGEHYTMLLPAHVHAFQKKFRAALAARGV